MSDRDGVQPPRGIAVIGLAGRFPGAAGCEELWHNLCAGVESIRFFSAAELLAAGVDAALVARPDYVRARGLLDGVEEIDAELFGWSPREAELTDPQHRLFLECAWQALEDAGCDPARFAGPIGIYGGAGVNHYLLRNLYPNRFLVEGAGAFQTSIHNRPDHLATRVAYELDLRGPAVTVQTACSTSLVAVTLACQSLLNYQCDMALAGGVTVTLPQVRGYLYQEGGIESPDGHCRAFDARAQGTVEGDGAGVVVLKRLADALADGDAVRAVILGAAINNDGAAKAGYTAPGAGSQAEVIAAAHAAAEVDADTISYVEAHGTGTPLGDPIEVGALTRAFRLTSQRRGFCALGSIKSNLGHLDAAAGIAGLIKTVLALERRQLPPSLHFESPNPALELAASPFFVNDRLRPWPAGAAPRRAGVSSFGIGGTNAHVVLEEAPPLLPSAASAPPLPCQLLVLSARSGPALETATANLLHHLRERPQLDLDGLADAAWTLQTGRAVFAHRRAVVAASAAEAVGALSTLDPERVFLRVQPSGHRPVSFLFPGQGAQYPGMGAGLHAALPVYRREVDRCLALLGAPLAAELAELLLPAAGALRWAATATATAESLAAGRRLARTALTQPALFVVEYALAQVWMDWGVRPESMLGHSIGEYVAACLAGVLTLPDALRLVALRGRLIDRLPPGAMLSAILPERELAARLGGELALAAVNGPSLGVVSGPAAAIGELERQLAAEGVVTRRLETSHAFHSAMIEPVLPAFGAALAEVQLLPPRIPFVSNLTGTWITAAEATDAAYWVEHLRRTVRFGDGVRELLREPQAVLLEVGPGRSLKTAARWHPAKTPQQVMETSLPHPREARADLPTLLGAAGRLWLAGVAPDWERLQGGRRRRVSLPGYPFERRRYWIEAPRGGGATQPRVPGGAAGVVDARGRTADLADWFYRPVWREAPLPPGLPAVTGPCLVLTGGDAFAERLADRLARTAEVIRVVPGAGFAAVGERRYRVDPRRHEDYAALLAALDERGLAPRAVVHLWSAAPPASAPEPSAALLDLGFYSLTALARALAGRELPAALPLVVVSTGLHAVTGGEPLRAEKATLLGPLKVIPRELPQVVCRGIDLELPAAGGRDGRRPLERLVESAAAEVAAAASTPAGEALVALRGGRRFVLGHAAVRLPGGAAPPLRERGVYLVTGGLGGIGLEVAEMLARGCGARLALVSRRELPPRASWAALLAEPAAGGGQDPLAPLLGRLLALEGLGAEVWVASADVADRSRVRELVAEVRERWGAVHGVFHAAGVADGGLLQLRSPESSAAVLAAKLDGTRALDEALAGEELDLFVLFSSLAGVVGRFGQVAYGAANAFLDAFAHERARTAGGLTLAVDWGEWEGVGMAAAAGLPASGARPVSGAGGAGGFAGVAGTTGTDRTAEMAGESLTTGIAHGAGEPGAAAAAGGHPLLDRHWVGPDGEEVYATDFHVARHWVVDEHRLLGNAVIPGVAYFEMLREALAGRAAGRALRFEEVVFVAPVRVRDGASREVRLHLAPDAEGGGYRFAVRSMPEVEEGGGSEPRDHVVGRVELATAAPPPRHDLAALKSRVGRRRVVFTEEDREDDLGPRWQNVRMAWVGDGEVLTRLELADEFAGDLESMRLHPALLDRAAGVAKEYLIEGTYLPLTYGRLTVYGPLPPRIYSYARYRAVPGSNLETVNFDISVLDDAGEVVAEIEEFSQKRVNDAAVQIRAYSGRRETAAAAAPAGERGAWRERPGEPGAPEEPRGRPAMTAAEGIEALRRLLAAGEAVGPQVAVSVRDLQTVIAEADAAAEAQALAGVAAPALAGSPAPGAGLAAAHPRPELDVAFVAPRSAAERAIAAAWQQQLGVGPIGVDDNFFALGGDSVQAIQILAALHQLGLKLRPQQFFQHQTVAALARLAGDADGGADAGARAAGAGAAAAGAGATAAGLAGAGAAPGETWRAAPAVPGPAGAAAPPLPPLPAFTAAEIAGLGLTAAAVEDSYPLSPLQSGMLFHGLYHPGSGDYVEQVAWSLDGALDEAAHAAAWDWVVARHSVLRTGFATELDPPMQVVHRDVAVPRARHEIQAGDLAAWMEADRRQGFDLGHAPLLRLAELCLPGGGRRFVWTYHHLLLDGWSAALVLREVFLAYGALASGSRPELPPPPPYRDFIAWLAGQDRAAEEEVWRQALAGAAPARPLESPAARAAAAETGYRTAKIAVAAAASDRLRALGRRHQLTQNSLLQGTWALLLARQGWGEDVLFGGVVSGRPPELPGIEGMVGVFINTLPVRAQVDEEAPALPWLARLQAAQAEARRYEHSALADIRRYCGWPADQPLFESLLAFENLPQTELPPEEADPRHPDGTGLAVPRPRDLARGPGRTGMPLTVEAFPGAPLLVDVTARSDRFDRPALTRLALQLRQLLEELARLDDLAAAAARAVPLSRLSTLTEAERHQVAIEWSTGAPLPRPAPAGGAATTDSIVSRFLRQVARAPLAIAVAGDGERLTYDELDRRSARLAGRLRARGAGPESVVALALPRGPQAIVALLAVLRAGGAYLPLDLASPGERLIRMLADAGAALLVAGRNAATGLAAAGGLLAMAAARLPHLGLLEIDAAGGDVAAGDVAAIGGDAAAGGDVTGDVATGDVGATGDVAATGGDAAGGAAPPPALHGESLAYVNYTSGSTGTPKGVAVPHRAVLRLIDGDCAGFGPDEVWGQLAPLSFDAATLEIWGALLHGGRLEILPDEALAPHALGAALRQRGVTALWLTAGLFHLVAAEDVAALGALRQLLAGGDVLRPEAVRRTLAAHPRLRLVNGYGPTESTTFTCCWRLHDPAEVAATVPLGRPIAGTSADVLDGRLRPVPIGAPGELCAGGLGLARGYLGRPELTAERFVPDPAAGMRGEPGARLYRTGDRVRRRPDGVIEFLGRLDRQVKIRGFRVEPEEVEAVLAAHPRLRQAAVGVRDSRSGDCSLVGYAVPEHLSAAGGSGAAGAAGGVAVTAAELASYLAERLPPYMLPATYLLLAALPLDANGKVDRRRLPAPSGEEQAAAATAPFAPPATAAERQLAAIWSELLEAGRVGRQDSFFELGGHSLLAIQAAARMRAAFHLEVPVGRVFETPVLAELAAWVEREQLAQADAGDVEALLAELETLSDGEAAAGLAGGKAAAGLAGGEATGLAATAAAARAGDAVAGGGDGR